MAGGVSLALAITAGCSYERADDGTAPFHESGVADASDAQVIEVGEDARIVRDKLCGEVKPGSCDPDRADLCTPFDSGVFDSALVDSAPPPDGPGADVGDTVPGPSDDASDATTDVSDVTDAATDDAGDDAGDALHDVPYDAFGSGSVRACRVSSGDNNI
jgi:hypothetical protein